MHNLFHFKVYLLMLICLVGLAELSNAQNYTRSLYVNVDSENLRTAPQGKKIGSLLQGTEAMVLYEQDKWVKVQVTGWIWKESMTSVRPQSVKGNMRAQHIMVATKQEADAILLELKSGKDFSEVAKLKSVGPNAKKGGDLGYFSKGDFQPEFEKAIEGLKVGEISDVVETELGFHIFKRTK